jgi:hypothetical protein
MKQVGLISPKMQGEGSFKRPSSANLTSESVLNDFVSFSHGEQLLEGLVCGVDGNKYTIQIVGHHYYAGGSPHWRQNVEETDENLSNIRIDITVSN